MDKYGVGWLLDQNNAEIEDEDSKPLFEELDINLKVYLLSSSFSRIGKYL